MCLGALVDAGVALDAIRGALAGLPLAGYEIESEKVTRSGIAATRVRVILAPDSRPEHRGLREVLEIIGAGNLPPVVARKACAVFRNLADAEARVHDTDPDSVHFHEVGAVDAICDIVGAAAGLDTLGLDELLFSTVRLGGGVVQAAHGTLPVPAPATVELLRGLPTAGGPAQVELTTPTGAALLKTLGRACPCWPDMSVDRVGYGAGARELPGHPNVLRLAVGRREEAGPTDSDAVWVLEANVDDMTGEEIGYCTERLMAAGALDVFVTPIQMKKNRPGVKLSVLCAPEKLSAMEGQLWRDSSTLGVRRSLWQRSTLRRRVQKVQTEWGEVRLKLALLGDELVRCQPEYEDCRRIAESAGVPLREVYRKARQALDGAE